MFEVGFSEIFLVGLVALVVIGPEKLPQVARAIGFWIGKTRSTVANLKAEAKMQFQIEELQQLIAEQHKAKALEDLIADTDSALQDVNQAIQTLPPAELTRSDL